MKKKFQYAILSAIALVGAVSFSSCSSSEETVVDPNPTFDGKSVKTQFTISLPENIKTRMASTTVQETGFRGIDNIKLVPYSLGAAAASDVQGTESPNAKLISLSPISAFDNTESNSKVYADVSLVVGTSNFLFYGKAVDVTAGTAITSPADKFTYGALIVAGLDDGTTPDLDGVEFTPVTIYGDYGTSEEQTAINAGKTVGTNLIAALNAVLDATPKDYNSNNELVEATLSDDSAPTFKEVTSEQSSSINNLVKNFKELSVSSSKNVELAFLDLCQNLDGFTTPAAKATAPNTYKMAIGIRAAIAEYATITVNSGLTTALTLKTNLTGYPASVNLPDGAARVAYNETSKKFEAATDINYASSMNVAALDRYVYPANLQYFVNSPVKVADAIKSPSYSGTWDNILNLYDGGTAVAADTRSVAITKQVQYGVARLDATVKGLVATTAEQPKYYDYTGAEIDVTNGFQLTGILVGGQKSVGWNYLPKGSTAYTIYDKTMNGSATEMTVKRGQATATNYTLVLQSGDQLTADKKVNVALEFINKGESFVGANGEIIHAGATFYLVGTLDVDAATNKADATVADAKDRVFTQDYKTIVNFTIKQGSATPTSGNIDGLGTATKGLPDLRTPQMELGLSVNLEWQSGLEFDVNI